MYMKTRDFWVQRGGGLEGTLHPLTKKRDKGLHWVLGRARGHGVLLVGTEEGRARVTSALLKNLAASELCRTWFKLVLFSGGVSKLSHP